MKKMVRAVARVWREIPHRYRLEGSKCKKCGKIWLPVRLLCAECKGKEMEKVSLKGEGKLLTWAIVKEPPKEFEQFGQYTVGIVELDEGAKIFAQITDHDELREGLRVRMVLRKIREEGQEGIIHYSYKFRPV